MINHKKIIVNNNKLIICNKTHNQKIGIFRKGRTKKLIKIGKIESSLVSLKNVNDDSGLLEENSGGVEENSGGVEENSGGVEESSGLLVKTQATQSTDGRGWELPPRYVMSMS